jgi:uncharacterized membrane protein YgcG
LFVRVLFVICTAVGFVLLKQERRTRFYLAESPLTCLIVTVNTHESRRREAGSPSPERSCGRRFDIRHASISTGGTAFGGRGAGQSNGRSLVQTVLILFRLLLSEFSLENAIRAA